jgi:soluble cytochrome b562
MSVSGISSSSYLYQTQNLQNWQAQFQKIQTEFQQLGQDLQAGNLTQAQSDYTTLSQYISSTTQTNSANSFAQEFSALGQALQSGNLSAAQQAYSTIQQGMQQAVVHMHHHHHHHGGGMQTSNSNSGSALVQAFAALGQALQSGSLSAAQSAYTTLQQDLQAFGWNAASTGLSGTSTVNVAA